MELLEVEEQVEHMLATIGAASIDDLFKTVPTKLRTEGNLDIPKGLSELELLRDTESLASRNRDCNQFTCFLGGGAYDHFIPTVVDAMAGQTEFLTAYTPYQAEASQGCGVSSSGPCSPLASSASRAT